MLMTTKGRYGLKMMFELALNYEQGPLPIKDMAIKLELSDTYLEQLMAVLKKAKLVNSTRGAQGGYTLARAPVNITVGEIIRSLEGPIVISDCVENGEGQCRRYDYCVTKVIWERITDSINSVIDTTSLGDMIKDFCELTNKNKDRSGYNE